jgi:hypothetical protein
LCLDLGKIIYLKKKCKSLAKYLNHQLKKLLFPSIQGTKAHDIKQLEPEGCHVG